jgi:hypothetical protein
MRASPRDGLDSGLVAFDAGALNSTKFGLVRWPITHGSRRSNVPSPNRIGVGNEHVIPDSTTALGLGTPRQLDGAARHEIAHD